MHVSLSEGAECSLQNTCLAMLQCLLYRRRIFFFKVTLNISKSFFLLQHVDKILYPDTVLDTSLRGALVSCIVRLHHFFINQLSCIQAKSEAIINFAFIQREMHVCVHSCTHTHNSHTQSLY